ncbi:MAG TPA: hypothetical protein VHE30_01720 [Polyangiaceae bacterium]|nr:hypothetical protein [Polyangiaceae bacterium]
MSLLPEGTDLLLWAVEVALLVWVARRSRRISPSVLACVACVAVAWGMRLASMALLFSRGHSFYWFDDAIRFDLAYYWSLHPTFVPRDTPWLPGTFALHGTAMRLASDPLVASRAMAALSNLVDLGGVFLFSQGVFGRRAVSAASVLVSGAFWLPTLLGTGTLSELSVSGFLLGGAGLLLLALRASGPRRRWLILASAAALGLATTFHVVAWTLLAVVLGALAVHTLRERGKPGALSPAAVLAFAAASAAFSAAYLVASARVYGSALELMHESAILEKQGGPLQGLVVYPFAVLFSVLGFAPLALAGVHHAWTVESADRARLRVVLVILGVCVGLLTVTAVRYGTTPTPYRSTLAITNALIPFATWSLLDSGRDEIPSARGLWLLAGALSVWSVVNVSHTLERRNLESVYDGALGHLDAADPPVVALATYLADEFRHGPRTLHPDNLARPIRVYFPNASGRDWLCFLSAVYRVGDPGRFRPSVWHLVATRVGKEDLEGIEPGELVLSRRILERPDLRQVTEFPPYRLYAGR